jgi:hypothetical protein
MSKRHEKRSTAYAECSASPHKELPRRSDIAPDAADAATFPAIATMVINFPINTTDDIPNRTPQQPRRKQE